MKYATKMNIEEILYNENSDSILNYICWIVTDTIGEMISTFNRSKTFSIVICTDNPNSVVHAVKSVLEEVFQRTATVLGIEEIGDTDSPSQKYLMKHGRKDYRFKEYVFTFNIR